MAEYAPPDALLSTLCVVALSALTVNARSIRVLEIASAINDVGGSRSRDVVPLAELDIAEMP
jgi:hypothetical protein